MKNACPDLYSSLLRYKVWSFRVIEAQFLVFCSYNLVSSHVGIYLCIISGSSSRIYVVQVHWDLKAFGQSLLCAWPVFLLYFLCKSVPRLGLSMWLTWMILLKVSFCRKRTPLVDWTLFIVFMHILVEMARFQSGVLLTFEGRSINPSWYLDGLTVCGKPFTQNSCCGYEARLRLCCTFFLTHSYKLWLSSGCFEERPELLFGKYIFMYGFTKW